MAEIVEYASQVAGIKSIMILTNGSLVTEERALSLKQFVTSISVSVDAWPEIAPTHIRRENNYHSVLAAIQAIKSAGITPHIIPTIHAKNIASLSDYVDLADAVGATINFSLLSCAKDRQECGELLFTSETHSEQLAKAIIALGESRQIAIEDVPVSTSLSIKESCGAGGHLISIGADGRVYPCHMLHADKFVMGDLLSMSLREALDSNIANEFQDWSYSNSPECAGCEFGLICGGGCRARAFFDSGDLLGTDSLCAMTKAFYSEVGAILNKKLGLKPN